MKRGVVSLLASAGGVVVGGLRHALSLFSVAYMAFGGAATLVNGAIIVLAASAIVVVWWAVFEPVVPLRSSEVVRVIPPDRIIDRDANDDLIVTRVLCMRHGAWATVQRYWVDGLEFKAPAENPIWLPEGCNERRRHQDVPATLPPGRYVYRVQLQFCNRMRCETTWVGDIPVDIRGRFPVQPTGSPPPIRDPL